MEYFIQFSALPVTFCMLQPLSTSGASNRQIHYCLGELQARPATNRAIRFSTGFLVTKALLSGSILQLWVVFQDFITGRVRNILPQHRVRPLYGQRISCAQLSSPALNERSPAANERSPALNEALLLESVNDLGFQPWPLDSSEIRRLTTQHAFLYTMDESRFEHLHRTKLKELLLPCRTRTEQELAIADHLAPEEIRTFLDRYEESGQRIKDLRSLSVVDSLKALHLASTNQDLRRVRDQVYCSIPGYFELQVKCPGGETGSYIFEWGRPASCLAPLDDDRDLTKDRLEALESERGLAPQHGDLTERERYHMPTGTVVRLITPSKSALCMPLGYLSSKYFEGVFIVVWNLESKDFGIVFDEDAADTDHLPTGVMDPHQRASDFPGTTMQVSIGVLRGLFEDDVATVEHIEAGGFSVFEAVRLGGRIQQD